MGFWSRLKTLAGGKDSIPTITVSGTTATITVPDTDSAIYVSSAAAATVTSMVCPVHLRNRRITIIGANDSTTAVTFTHTSIALLTPNKMTFQANLNRLVNRLDWLEMVCDENGKWFCLNT